jgi:hypothetical protein
LALWGLFREGAAKVPSELVEQDLVSRLEEHRRRFGAAVPDLPALGEGGTVTYLPGAWEELRRWRPDRIRGLPDEVAASLMMVLLAGLADQDGSLAAIILLPTLSRRKLPLDRTDAALAFALAHRVRGYGLLHGLKAAVTAAGRLPPEDRLTLEKQFAYALEQLDRDESEPSDRAKVRVKLRGLLASGSRAGGRVDVSAVHQGDGWGRFAVELLRGRHDAAGAIPDLVSYLATATSGPRPTRAWVKRASELIERAPDGEGLIRDLLDGVLTCQPVGIEQWGQVYETRVGPSNGDLVRGLIWAAAIADAPWLIPTLSGIAEDRMPTDPKLVNACFAALGRCGTPDAIAALVQLQRRTRDRGNLKQIAKALDEAAAAADTPRSALLEAMVPTSGLDDSSERRVTIGDAEAVLALGSDGRVTLLWEQGDAASKRVPEAVASEYADQAARIKRDATELRELVATERARLEELLLEDREWLVDGWFRIYMRHPVTGKLASRLIWWVEERSRSFSAIPWGAGSERLFRLPDGSETQVGDAAKVRPWHPIQATADEVRAWRAFLMDDEIVQPFKQAFREMYLLTPAEEQTGTYSNRFAAHVLDYQQTYALMKERRWATNYLGGWDGGFDGEAKRDFEASGLRASFFHEPIETDTNAFRVEYCSTDQVRFTHIGDRSREPISLVDVPPVVFSEAMRDVDLFVGVASIAADPTWANRGEDRHFEYWERAAFADLTPNGETRKDVLEALLPKLKIRDRARVEGRYLVVDGTKHTYKIHLGSGNILMSPNDRYLCIVPARGSRPKGIRFVPFEGDHILGVILSKAFMLADDHKITDESILRQLV